MFRAVFAPALTPAHDKRCGWMNAALRSNRVPLDGSAQLSILACWLVHIAGPSCSWLFICSSALQGTALPSPSPPTGAHLQRTPLTGVCVSQRPISLSRSISTDWKALCQPLGLPPYQGLTASNGRGVLSLPGHVKLLHCPPIKDTTLSLSIMTLLVQVSSEPHNLECCRSLCSLPWGL